MVVRWNLDGRLKIKSRPRTRAKKRGDSRRGVEWMAKERGGDEIEIRIEYNFLSLKFKYILSSCSNEIETALFNRSPILNSILTD